MNTSNGLAISDNTLGAIVDQLDNTNDLLGVTEGDDGIDVLASKSNTSTSVVTGDQDDSTDAASAPAAAVVTETATVSKASVAREIFNREYPRVLKGETRRCDVIKLFVSQAGLTDKGAGTYYQGFTVKYKKAAELAAGTATADATDNTEAGDDTDGTDSAE